MIQVLYNCYLLLNRNGILLIYNILVLEFIEILFSCHLVEISCSCVQLPTFNANEECGFKNMENDLKKMNRSSIRTERMCYVKMPTNCSDLLDSKVYPGLQMSAEACKGKM